MLPPPPPSPPAHLLNEPPLLRERLHYMMQGCQKSSVETPTTRFQ